MVIPVTDRTVAKVRLRSSADMTGANRAPKPSRDRLGRAMKAHIVMSMLPSSSG
jgi:hypothetical protein